VAIKNKEELENYKLLLEKLMEETRSLLLEVKKERTQEEKIVAKENLFDQFIYVNSLKNSATTRQEYKEVYEILEVSIQQFCNQIV